MISLILPLYNEESSVLKMLNSILNQTHTDYEVIIVNDGSTDGTEQVCKEFVNEHKSFKYFYQKNGGVAKARNLALEHCTGELIGFLDGDDYIEANYLEKLSLSFDSPQVDLVICSYSQNGRKILMDNMLLSRDETLEEIAKVNGSKGYLWNKLFKSEIIKNHKIHFNDQLKVSSDLPFCVQYVLYCSNVKYISDVLIHYSVNAGSISGNINNTKIITQLDSYHSCIVLLESNHVKYSIKNLYITLFMRSLSGIIFRSKFDFSDVIIEKFNTSLKLYSYVNIVGFKVKMKYFFTLVYIKYLNLRTKKNIERM